MFKQVKQGGILKSSSFSFKEKCLDAGYIMEQALSLLGNCEYIKVLRKQLHDFTI